MVKGKNGIYWDKDAKSQGTTKTGAGETYIGPKWSDVQAYQASHSTSSKPDSPKLSPGDASVGGTTALSQQSAAVDYQDMSQATISLAVAKNVAIGFGFEYAGAQAASAVKSLFSIGEASRVFWSGGEVAKTAAADFATANGMQTLEMTKAGRFMNAINPSLPGSISSPIWNSL